MDGLLEVGSRPVDAPPQLFFRQQEAFDLDEADVGVKWTCQRGRLANRLRMVSVLWVA